MTERAPEHDPTIQAIVIAGDLTKGFRFVGPFPSMTEAQAHIARHKYASAYVAPLELGDGRSALAMMACHVLIHGTDEEQPGSPECVKKAEAFARLALAS